MEGNWGQNHVKASIFYVSALCRQFDCVEVAIFIGDITCHVCMHARIAVYFQYANKLSLKYIHFIGCSGH